MKTHWAYEIVRCVACSGNYQAIEFNGPLHRLFCSRVGDRDVVADTVRQIRALGYPVVLR